MLTTWGQLGFVCFCFSGGVHVQGTNGCNDLSFNAAQVLKRKMGPFSDFHHQDTLGRAEGKNPCVIFYAKISWHLPCQLDRDHPGPRSASAALLQDYKCHLNFFEVDGNYTNGCETECTTFPNGHCSECHSPSTCAVALTCDKVPWVTGRVTEKPVESLGKHRKTWENIGKHGIKLHSTTIFSL